MVKKQHAPGLVGLTVVRNEIYRWRGSPQMNVISSLETTIPFNPSIVWFSIPRMNWRIALDHLSACTSLSDCTSIISAFTTHMRRYETIVLLCLLSNVTLPDKCLTSAGCGPQLYDISPPEGWQSGECFKVET